jgi:hypothetical protein
VSAPPVKCWVCGGLLVGVEADVGYHKAHADRWERIEREGGRVTFRGTLTLVPGAEPHDNPPLEVP